MGCQSLPYVLALPKSPKLSFKMMFMQRYKGFIALLLTSLITITLVVTRVPHVGAINPEREIRGVWLTNVDSDVLFSRRGTKAALKRLQKFNFNTVYPTVWQGGYTLYPSKVAEEVFGVAVDPTPGLQKRDLLRELVQQGHKRGLTVIPWLEFGFMAPADSELVQKHPDWLTYRHDGSYIHIQGEDRRVWLNPNHPEVQQFILDLAVEIVSNYDVDGIQFDDHFGLPAEFGYDELTVEMYQGELKGLSPPESFSETFWVRWRADKINEFMGRLSATIKEIKPDCIISVSPNPLHFSLPAYLQDWLTWERKGYISEIVLQVYRSELEHFVLELERVEVELAKNNIPVAIGILSGLKNRPTSMSEISSQVQEVRERGFAGVSFFFYESLWKWAEDPPVVRERYIHNLFPTPVSRL